MKRLRVIGMGDEVQGVELKGDRRNPEPTYFRVCLPFGDVDITRTSNGEYWVHVRVNRPVSGGTPGARPGRVKDARIDAHDKHAGELDASLLVDPNLYHLAVRLGEDR